MARALQDPRYVLPLCALLAITAVSVLAASVAIARSSGSTPALARSGGGASDSQRLQDLALIRAALAIYREQHGVFPSTVAKPAKLCVQADDPGCVLRRITRALPTGDGSAPYWYASDGLRYTLFARADAADAHHACVATPPPELAGGPVLCVTDGALP